MTNRDETSEIILRLPRIFNACGNLSKKWYIEFYVRSPYSGKLERFRKYRGLNKFKSLKHRQEVAEEMCNHWREKLKSGWMPIKSKDLINDFYNSNINEFSYKKESINHFKPNSRYRTKI